MTEYLHGLLDPQLFSNIIRFRIKCRKVEKKHMDERRERDYTLDYLRALGTALVIFAHITTPTGILEIRTFDVTMLVFVSGASYALSAKEKQILHTKEYFEYIFNRFKRLIVPTWIFLTLYFILFHLLNEYSCVGVPLFRRNGYRQSGGRKPLFRNRDTALT